MSLLGLDIGTSGCKATILDYEGNALASRFKEYPLLSPRPGWLELDPNTVLNSVKEIIAEAARSYRGDAIRAISISSFGESVVPIGATGNPLDNSIIYSDVRGKTEAAYFERRLGNEAILAITGSTIHPIYSINKILWLKNNRPDVFRAVWKFLPFADFILFKLGARPCTDYSLATRTMAFDIVNKTWSHTILECAEIDERLFGTPVQAGTVAGEIDPAVAAGLGLPTSTILVTGGHDQVCAALGAGVIRGNIAVDGLGTVECITPAFDRPLLSRRMADNNFVCIPHVKTDLYATYAFNFAAGALIKWFRSAFAQEEEREAAASGGNVYECIIRKASPHPTDIFVLPHFSYAGAATPYMDTASKGAIVGLSVGCGKAEIIRSLFEGLTYEMMVNMERLRESGVFVNELRAVGGLAQSEWFLQLKADMMGMEIVSLNVREAGALGVAMLAGAASGVYASLEDAVEKLIRIKKRYVPDPAITAVYRDKFERYKKMYPAIKSVVS